MLSLSTHPFISVLITWLSALVNGCTYVECPNVLVPGSALEEDRPFHPEGQAGPHVFPGVKNSLFNGFWPKSFHTLLSKGAGWGGRVGGRHTVWTQGWVGLLQQISTREAASSLMCPIVEQAPLPGGELPTPVRVQIVVVQSRSHV